MRTAIESEPPAEPRTRQPGRGALDWAIVLGAVGAATLVRLALDPFLGNRLPFLLYVLVLIPIGWWCRTLPTVVGSAVALAAGVYFFTDPRFSLLPLEAADGLVTGLYATVLAVSAAGASVHQRKARMARALVEQAARNAAEAREREARQRAAFEQAAVGTAELEPHGFRILATNARLARLIGGDGRPVVGTPLLELLGEPDRAAVFAQLTRLVTGARNEWVGETLLLRRGRHPIPVQLAVAAVRAEAADAGRSGPVRSLVLIVQDFSDRERAESTARRALERLEIALKAADLAAWEVDLTAGRVLCSDAAEEIFGFSSGTIEEFTAATHPEDLAAVQAAFHGAVASGEPYAHQHRMIRRTDGAVRWVHTTGRVQRDRAGKAVRITGVVRDITERRLAEAESERNRQLVEKIAATMPDALTVEDIRQGRRIYVSRRIESVLGYGPEQRGGEDPASPTTLMHPDDTAATVADDLALRDAPDGQVLRRTVRVRHASGDRRWLMISKTPFARDADGQVSQILTVATDVTDQKLTEQRLAEHARRLAQTNAELEDFTHMAAHDLKEPLRGIRTYAHFLAEDLADHLDDAAREKLIALDRLAARMYALLDGLLEYTRVANLDPAMERLSLGVPVYRAIEASRPLIHEHGATVRVAADLPEVRCAPALLEQAVRELIRNAIVFNRSAVKVVTIDADPSRGAPVLRVADNGIGVPPEHAEKIFRLFKRLHTRDEFGGAAGVGLAIVRRIAQIHGGSAWAEPAPSGGTVLYVALGPCSDATPSPEGPAAAQSAPTDVELKPGCTSGAALQPG